MSRAYNMGVQIVGYDPAREDAITDAARDEWQFDEWWGDEGTISSDGDGSLCGGETEEEFADRLSKAVWKANGRYCEVSVTATYLEDLPFETHCRDEEDYQRLMGQPA